MNGKSKCKILKDIRKKIAEDNDITYVTSECKYQGECSGTCPKCEAELRYLEEELTKRKSLGKTVAVAGIAAALVVGSAGCAESIPDQSAASSPSQESTAQTEPSETAPSTTVPLPGEVVIDESTHPSTTAPAADEKSSEVTTLPFENELAGEPVYPPDITMGDIPIDIDSTWWN